MKALVYEGAETIVPRDVPVARPGADEVLLEVTAVGICLSDKHAHDYGWKLYRPGMVIGHEGAGIVREVGSDVQRLRAGDHVAVDPRIYCGTCRACVRGLGWACETRATGDRGNGLGTNALRDDGSMLHGLAAEYCTVPEYTCYPLPESFSSEMGACVETAAVGIHAARQSKIRAGDHVLFLGFDDYALQMLRMLPPARCVVVDPVAVRQDQAHRCRGVRAVVDPSQEGWKAEALAALDGPADVVIVSMEDYIPEAARYPRSAADLVTTGGAVESLRFYMSGGHALTYAYRRFLAGVDFHQLGSFQSDATRSGRSDYEIAIEQGADGIDLASHVTCVEPLTELKTQGDVAHLFESLPEKQAKILLRGTT